MTLEQTKTLIGTTAIAPVTGQIEIVKVRQLSDGKILIYNKHNWCCNIETVKDINGKDFVFEDLKKEMVNAD